MKKVEFALTIVLVIVLGFCDPPADSQDASQKPRHARLQQTRSLSLKSLDI